MLIMIGFKIPIASAEESNFELTGDILQIAIPATAYLSTFYLDDDEGRTQFYYSFFTNLAVTHGLKYTINKPRPEGHGDYSFPSGHTSAAFQGATFIQKRYGWKYGLPAYICASYVGWSRIEGESDKHDLTDVLGGAAVGILSTIFFTTPYSGVTVTPVADAGCYGLNINFAW
ncbi:MAG: phosphatase PAP2 family protein [Deltaproteobacteria bacterium]|nr:phosphatase PAP2 family protein [Deltaproteobacteria bacterium]